VLAFARFSYLLAFPRWKFCCYRYYDQFYGLTCF